jgi:hypothetical protein
MNAFTYTLDEIGRTNLNRLDKERRRAILQIVKRPQVDIGFLGGVTEQAIDKGCDGIAVRLREWSHGASPSSFFVRRTMGDEGQPNFAQTPAMKSASRCPSHWQKAPQLEQVTRFACGPALLPMMPMLLPQFGHGCRSWAFRPTRDFEDDGGAIVLGNSSPCSNMT